MSDYPYTDYNFCPDCGEPVGVCQCADYHDYAEDDEPTEDYIEWLIARFDPDNGGV